MHTQDAHCSGFGCVFCSACWQLRVAAVVFFRGHEEKGGEGVRSPSLLSCGCGAPRVTALSWASCPIEGGMAGNFGAALWMDDGLFAPCGWCGGCSLRVRCVVAAGFCHFPLAVGMGWENMVVDFFSSCMVGGCWRCVPFLCGCRLVVCGLCGWACCLLLMLSALSLAVSTVLRPSPSCCIVFLLSHRSADWLQRLHYE
ncbi:hypothetical protein TcCL_ESM09790 [Trypanosoma cruzi]|nr:hypothetical protein TcCL_ESM09790 [Trypanosoma cruzi]